MVLKRLLRVSNLRVRLLVGLFIAALVCVQCTQRSEATRISPEAAIAIAPPSGVKSQSVSHIEQLARTDHIALLEMCLEQCRERYSNYTCTFNKQERLGGQLGREQEIQVKFQDKPFSVAMHWTRNSPIADRAIYVQGKWNNKMMVHPAGLLAWVGPQLRSPDDALAMKNTLRPINKFGFEKSLQSLIDVYKDAKSCGELKQELGYLDPKSGKRIEYVKIDGRDAIVLSRTLPDKECYPAARTLVYIDLEYMVPVMVEGYDWDDQLTCRYVFRNIRFNVGLNDDDFLPEANGMAREGCSRLAFV